MVDFFQVNGFASGTWAQPSHTLHYHKNSTYPSPISSTFQNVFCTGNLSQSFFEEISGSLWPHPLFSELSMVRVLQPANAPPDRNCLQHEKWCPYREAWFLHPFVLTKWEEVQPIPTKAIPQPPRTTTMCTACLKYARPPPPLPASLLAQNQRDCTYS